MESMGQVVESVSEEQGKGRNERANERTSERALVHLSNDRAPFINGLVHGWLGEWMDIWLAE